MGLAVLLHVLSVVVWVGGMFFAYMFLRPVAAAELEPPQRLDLEIRNFERFGGVRDFHHELFAAPGIQPKILVPFAHQWR